MRKNIYSGYLKKEFPAKETKKGFLVQHNDLDVFISENPDIKYEMTVVSTDNSHPIVTCRMKAGDNTVMTVGEATEETLWTDAERKYPVTVAWNRAFDRAAIRILDFEMTNVFSNKEVKIVSEKKTEKKPLEAKPEHTDKKSELPPVEQKPVAVPVAAEPVNSVPEVNSNRKSSFRTKETEKKKESYLKKKVPYFKDNVTGIDSNTKILFGMWTGKSFAEAAKDINFIRFCEYIKKNQPKFNNPDMDNQVRFIVENIPKRFPGKIA